MAAWLSRRPILYASANDDAWLHDSCAATLQPHHVTGSEPHLSLFQRLRFVQEPHLPDQVERVRLSAHQRLLGDSCRGNAACDVNLNLAGRSELI